MLDLERIIQAGIPDIAPVYGGARGRTLSSRKQAYAWQTVVEVSAATLQARMEVALHAWPTIALARYGSGHP